MKLFWVDVLVWTNGLYGLLFDVKLVFNEMLLSGCNDFYIYVNYIRGGARKNFKWWHNIIKFLVVFEIFFFNLLVNFERFLKLFLLISMDFFVESREFFGFFVDFENFFWFFC